MGSVDRRVESEESGDEEGKKQNSGMVADLSAHSLKDGEERGDEDPEGTGLGEGLRPTQRQDASSAACAQPGDGGGMPPGTDPAHSGGPQGLVGESLKQGPL